MFAELLYTASITLKKTTLKKSLKKKIIPPTLFVLYQLKRKDLQALLPLTYQYVTEVPGHSRNRLQNISAHPNISVLRQPCAAMPKKSASLGTASQQAYYAIFQFTSFFARKQPPPPVVTDFYIYQSHSGIRMLYAPSQGMPDCLISPT